MSTPEQSYDPRKNVSGEFLCAGCRIWVSWEDGAADSTPDLCDTCAFKANADSEKKKCQTK